MSLPAFWDDLRGVGWLGLHLPEEYGGSGYGLAELVVVVEALASSVAAGPYVPSVIGGAVIAVSAPKELQQKLLPGLADGSLIAGIALDSRAGAARRTGLRLRRRRRFWWSGECLRAADRRRRAWSCETAAGASRWWCRRISIHRGDQPSSSSTVRPRTGARRCPPFARRHRPADLRRRSGRIGAIVRRAGQQLRQDPAPIRPRHRHVPGGQASLRQHGRRRGAGYGGGLGCRARSGASAATNSRYAAAVAASLAFAAADQNAQLNIQVHGGIGFTWEHDAHLYLRRATALKLSSTPSRPRSTLTDLLPQRAPG